MTADTSGTVPGASPAAFAERMHAALAGARWEPGDDPGEVAAVLATMATGVCGWVDTVQDGLTVFDSKALASAYLFCASVEKALSLDYARQHPDHQDLSAEAHLARVRNVFPQFQRKQRDVLRQIESEFPGLV